MSEKKIQLLKFDEIASEKNKLVQRILDCFLDMISSKIENFHFNGHFIYFLEKNTDYKILELLIQNDKNFFADLKNKMNSIIQKIEPKYSLIFIEDPKISNHFNTQEGYDQITFEINYKINIDFA